MPSPPASRNQRADSFAPKVNFLMGLISVKVIFSLHFILLTIALALLHWMPQIYLYYNTLFFALLFWSTHSGERNVEPVMMAAVVNATAIALDIICICTTYDYYRHLDMCTASLVFIILNLVLRPFTTFILARLYYSKNRSDWLPNRDHGGIANNGPSLSSAIRKLLFLNAENGEINHNNVDASGTYRAHQKVEQKNSAPLAAAVLSVSSQQVQVQQQQPPQPEQPQVEAQIHPQRGQQSESETQPAETAQQQLPQPQPRQSQLNRQSTWTDPESGEQFQERMI